MHINDGTDIKIIMTVYDAKDKGFAEDKTEVGSMDDYKLRQYIKE